MPVYLSSQHFSAFSSYGVLIVCALLIVGLALYLDITKGQGRK